MKQREFSKGESKRIICPNCAYILGETFMGETKTRNIRCRKCKVVMIVHPPTRKTREDGMKIITFGPSAMYTADLTEDQIEDSL